ncbi:hypothetical protein BH10ACT11_BH10ACT11_05660 [soil metagenome]
MNLPIPTSKSPSHATRLLAALALATLLAIVCAQGASAKTPKSFYGVDTQDSLGQSDYRKMANSNVHVLRLPIYWQLTEPRPSKFDFSRFDAMVKAAAKQRIGVVPYLYGTPRWVAKQLDHRKCGSKCGVYAPRSAKALSAWKAFARKAAARYGPGGRFWAMHPGLHREPIRSWQIWNEQNSKTFYKPKPDPRRYAKVLSNASKAIRGVDRKADIVLGGMFGTPGGGKGNHSLSTAEFLHKLYRVGGIKRQFNGIALHPYSKTVRFVKKQVDYARDALRDAHDLSADLWITEIGWASGGRKSALNVGSKRAQAKKVTEAYKTFERNRRAWNVRGVFWYAWQDSNAANDICFFCAKAGLTTAKGKSKPSLGAYRRVAR